jgi:hypothetical protein
VGKPEGKRPLEKLYVDHRILLKRILEKWDFRVWFGLNSLMIGSSEGLL